MGTRAEKNTRKRVGNGEMRSGKEWGKKLSDEKEYVIQLQREEKPWVAMGWGSHVAVIGLVGKKRIGTGPKITS